MPQFTDEDLREIYASAPVDEYELITLELIHATFEAPGGGPDSIRIALDDQDWDLPIEDNAPLFGGQTKTFEALALDVTMPAQEEGSLGEMEIAIDNVPQQYMNRLRRAVTVRSPASVICRKYILHHDTDTGDYTLASTDGPVEKIDQLSIKRVRGTTLRLTSTARFVDILNTSVPRRIFTRDGFPGLF
ncbi:DUF1833 family protein [Microbaculum marinum]|uniref:DUF1833 family protein n=1 Tax=Microbaculum marinum TaxID=1764581 RepID=A0AAW9RUP6_9HYPH